MARQCKCGESRLEMFTSDPRSRDGLHSQCKTCRQKYRAKHSNVWKPTSKLCSCGKLLPYSRRSLCYSCHPKHFTLTVHLFCSLCDKRFDLREGIYKRRLDQKLKFNPNPSDALYCSKRCGNIAVRPHGPRRTLKVRKWRSNEQQYWEQMLHDVGLGMGRGLTPMWLWYGLHRFSEEIGEDGKIRIKTFDHGVEAE